MARLPYLEVSGPISYLVDSHKLPCYNIHMGTVSCELAAVKRPNRNTADNMGAKTVSG